MTRDPQFSRHDDLEDPWSKVKVEALKMGGHENMSSCNTSPRNGAPSASARQIRNSPPNLVPGITLKHPAVTVATGSKRSKVKVTQCLSACLFLCRPALCWYSLDDATICCRSDTPILILLCCYLFLRYYETLLRISVDTAVSHYIDSYSAHRISFQRTIMN